LGTYLGKTRRAKVPPRGLKPPRKPAKRKPRKKRISQSFYPEKRVIEAKGQKAINNQQDLVRGKKKGDGKKKKTDG